MEKKNTKNKEVTNTELMKRIERLEKCYAKTIITYEEAFDSYTKKFKDEIKNQDIVIKHLSEIIQTNNKELRAIILNKSHKLEMLLSQLNKKFINHEHLDKAVMLNLSKYGDGGK